MASKVAKTLIAYLKLAADVSTSAATRNLNAFASTNFIVVKFDHQRKKKFPKNTLISRSKYG